MASEESHWDTVSEFMSAMKNASRLGTYVDAVVQVFESDAWRRYTDATGRTDEWLSGEFDYFLIACGAEYPDVQRLLSWDSAKASGLASAMQSESDRNRRTLEEASEAWKSPTGTPLRKVAERHGWTKGGGSLRAPPLPQRARAQARHGMSQEDRARQRRVEALGADRVQELDEVAAYAADQISTLTELRYLMDALRVRLREQTQASERKSPSDD